MTAGDEGTRGMSRPQDAPRHHCFSCGRPPGTHAPDCAEAIRIRLDQVLGVSRVQAELDRRKALVRYFQQMRHPVPVDVIYDLAADPEWLADNISQGKFSKEGK